MFIIKTSLYLFTLFSLTACGTHQLALKKDYQVSQQAYREGKYYLAKENFPKKEADGFITSTEKLYIDLLHSEPQPEKLLQFTRDLEKRQVIYVTQEATNFFYRETEDGYYPSEHEVITFHILMGYAFAKMKKKESACVEARRASEYLESAFDDRRKTFDDPGLRLWLAGLFTYCSEWEQAKVDLRVAANQLHNNKLLQLSQRELPPQHLHIALLGDGPEVHWQGNTQSVLPEKIDKVSFDVEKFENVNVQLVTDTQKTDFAATTGTEAWYLRHQQRNTEIREILNQSKYMVKALGASTQATLHKTGAALVSGAAMTGGILLAGVLIGGSIYLVVQLGASCGSECGKFVVLVAGVGWVAGKALFNQGKKFFKRENKKANENLDNDLDISKNYRYVRFLPEKILFTSSEEPAQVEENIMGVKSLYSPFLTLKNDNSEIHLYQWTP